MKQWHTIIKDINNALSRYDHSVSYQRPMGHGSNGECGYFTISINEDYEWEDIEVILQKVVDDWDLDFDWRDSEEDLDLNAYWDRK